LRIALISYHHPESTIPLAKNLSSEDTNVDYYYILEYNSSKNIPGFDISNTILHFGLNKLSFKNAPETFRYMGNNKFNIFIIYTPPKINIRVIKNVFLSIILFQINSRKYDLINFVGQQKLLILFHEKLSCSKKIHTLHEVTDHFNNKNLNNPLLDYLFKNKIKIIVHSEESLKKICHYENCDKSMVFKIPFGLFETYLNYEPLNLIPPTVKYILFFGFIRSYKGLDILLASIKLLKNIDVKFVIAGSGYIDELEDFKRNDQCIVINRLITNNELVGLIKGAQFIICPYKSASQSGIIMTTFLFGRPIIASDVGAFSEVIIDGANGILVNPNSPTELANAIKALSEDKELYKRMQKEVYELNNKLEFNWHEIAHKTKEVYLRK
jgi:glycosyltransferase involved in cell wall biosynthesis